MTASARLLMPIAVTPAMLGAGTTIADPAPGETAWVSAATYTTAQERTYAGSVYGCVADHTGRTATPAADPTYWLRKGPTKRMAPFDDYAATTATAIASLTYVINPTFIDGINLYGVNGAAYSITVKNAPGGTVTASKSGDLYEQAIGFYELLFSPLVKLDRVALDGIPLSPTTEVTISVTGGASDTVAVGDIKVGSWRILTGDANAFGGAEYGASSERKTYTSRIYNPDGTYKTVLRGSYRDVKCTVVIDAAQAMYADAVLAEAQDIAVPFEACGLPRYSYLATLGFVSASMSADTWGTTKLDLTIKGNI